MEPRSGLAQRIEQGPDQSRVCRIFVGIVVRACSEAHLPLLSLLLFADRPACCRRPCRAWMVVLATR